MNSKICLTCLDKPCEIYYLNDVIMENLKVRDLLHQLVPLILEENTMLLPDIICERCMEELVISFKFQKKCLDSLQNLRTRGTEENSLIQDNEDEITDDGITDNNDETSISSQLTTFDAVLIDPLMDNDEKNILFDNNDLNNFSGKSKIQIKDNINSSKILPASKEADKEAGTNQCNICQRYFKQPQGLACHMSAVHLKKHLYQCRKCGKGYDYEDPFIKHCNYHLSIKSHPCSKSFEHVDQLNKPTHKHSKSDRDDISYTCKMDKKRFDTCDIFKKHAHGDDEKVTHSKNEKEDISYTCKICKEKFDDFDLFKQHGHDDGKKAFHCVKCDKTYKTFSAFGKHFKTHRNENVVEHVIKEKSFHVPERSDHKNETSKFNKMPRNKTEILRQPIEKIVGKFILEKKEEDDDGEIQKVQKIGSNHKVPINMSVEEPESNQCDICQQTFKNYHGLARHRTTTHFKNFLYQCDHCDKGFDIEKSYIKHRNKHLMEQTDSSQCNICHQTFKNTQGLAIHRSITHFKNFLYQCDQCDKGFNTEKCYINHRNKHLGIKLFKCNKCDKAFQNNGLLNQHLISHSEATPHLCTICGKGFRYTSSLTSHMRRHSNERPFKCSICPKAFKCLSDKMRHMIYHSGKRYECNICGTSVASSNYLSLHKMIHSGEKPSKCRYCDKSFIVSANLKKHERIHTGEKPYKCDYCWKSFCQSSDRKKHMRRMHKDELANKKIE